MPDLIKTPTEESLNKKIISSVMEIVTIDNFFFF